MSAIDGETLRAASVTRNIRRSPGFATVVVSVGSAILLVGCAPNGGACSSLGNALLSGAMAGLSDATTGQDTPNPCLQTTGQNSQQASLQPQQQTPSPVKADRAELVRKYGHKHADLILVGQIAKGMNEDEVTLAWGAPNSEDNDKFGRLVWKFGSDTVVFKHEKVSEVRH